MGLQKKILLYAGAGLLALMSLLTWISLQTNRQATDMVYQERLALVKNVASGADEIVGYIREETVENALLIGQGWDGELGDKQKYQLAAARNSIGEYPSSSQQPGLITAGLLDSSGKILWTDPYNEQNMGRSLADTTTFKSVKRDNTPYIGVESVLTQENPAVSLAAPIIDEHGQLQGFLLINIPTLPPSSGFSVFFSHQSGNYTLELVTNNNGMVLSKSNAGQEPAFSQHWQSVQNLVEAHQAGIVTHAQTGEEEHLVAFAPLNQAPWGVILERPQEKSLSLPWMGERPLLVSGLVLFLAAGLMWFVTRQIISPLRRLAATAQSMGAGDLDAPIPVTAHDEIGNLAENLDNMRSRLKRSLSEISQLNRDLEQRVKERTSELEDLDQQLREQNKERTALLGKIITTQEEERQRIARELHDEVGQSITSLMIGFRVLETQDPVKMRQGIAELKRLSANTLDEVRHLALELRPSSIDDLGLVAALQQYTREYTEKFGVSADFQASGFEGKRLRPEVEIAVYRIIQEALTNVAKHADATKVSVLMSIRNSSIVAIVEDNGKGFDVRSILASPTEKKLGLYGMQERASLIGGWLTVESTPGKGTTIFVEVPLKGE